MSHRYKFSGEGGAPVWCPECNGYQCLAGELAETRLEVVALREYVSLLLDDVRFGHPTALRKAAERSEASTASGVHDIDEEAAA